MSSTFKCFCNGFSSKCRSQRHVHVGLYLGSKSEVTILGLELENAP